MRFEVDFRIPSFAGMTEGTGVQFRHAGEPRQPGVVPETQLLNINAYDAFATQTYWSGSNWMKPFARTMADVNKSQNQRARERRGRMKMRFSLFARKNYTVPSLSKEIQNRSASGMLHRHTATIVRHSPRCC